jgi:archaeosine synthase alpha-subunit
MRTVERLEGLALVGHATVGPLSLPTPGLIESRPQGEEGEGLVLTNVDAPLASRHLRLSSGTATLDLEYPVPAPEVVGPAGGVIAAGPGAWLVRPPFPPATAGVARERTPELLVWSNARTLYAEGLPFVRGIRELRATFGSGPVLWAPRLALPHRLPLLAYLGIDLVDTTEGLAAAARGEYLDPGLGRTDASVAEAEGLYRRSTSSREAPEDLGTHTLEAYERAMAEVRTAARTGRLRELVEARLPAEPALAEMLRYADRELAGPLEERAPVTGDGSHDYVLLESHRRPEMARFRSRLIARYVPPRSKSVLLIVPCSRTKPYRSSRSHRRFAAALEGLSPLERVHLVSVSSPIGLVPRELEDVPPARHYDIPVTGDWEAREQAVVVEGLHHLARAGQYRTAVVHLDPEEYAFLRQVWPPGLPASWTLDSNRTTTREALEALRSAVADALADERPVQGGPLAVVREELHEVAAVQFGRAAADRLFAPSVRLAGRPWFQRLTDGRGDLATLREERGLLHLTVAGARRLVPNPPLWVEVDPTLSLAGDLFVPGVRGADPGIRVGDSVVLLREGILAGVGEAALPGRLMTELRHGVAVRVRHREHAPTDTTMSEEPSPTSPGPVV